MLARLNHSLQRSKWLPKRLFSGSKYFDTAYYLRVNPDVAAARVDPFLHYCTCGWRERRNPSPYFNVNWYLSRYLDVAEAGVEPLQHFVIFGRKEGRQPHHLFDPAYYLYGAPDVVAAGMDGLLHFVRYGDREGRSPHPLFDPLYYRRSNPEIGTTPAFAHFSEIGARQLYSPCPAFDARYYFRHYPDSLNDKMEPLLHYLLAPTASRRHFHPLIDAHYQRATATYSSQGMDPLIEYVQFRSHFDTHHLHRGATSVPTPRRALLKPRASVATGSVIAKPKVSIIVPCYKSDARYLESCVNSIRSQHYRAWELILIDDHSPDETTWPLLQKFQSVDHRIKAFRTDENLGISGATNAGILASRGAYIAFVDHDDVLTPDALDVMMTRIVSEDADVAYSDQAYRSADDNFDEPFYKPDWSPTLFWGVMYVGHLLIVRAEVVRHVGMFDAHYDGCQDFEFMLRVSEHTGKIIHVPQILYHWRRAEGSVASSSNAKGALEPKQARAVGAHLRRCGLHAAVKINDGTPHRLSIRALPRDRAPVIDVVLQGPAVTEIAHDFATRLLGSAKANLASVRVLHMNGSSAPHIPEGTAAFVLFANLTFSVRGSLWLQQLLLHADRNNVGFVTPQFCTPDGRIAAAGLVVDKSLGLLPAHHGAIYGEDGYAGSLLCDREVSAVSGCFALVSREKLNFIGGISLRYGSLHGGVADASYRATLSNLSNICVASSRIEVPVEFTFDDLYSVIDHRMFAETHHNSLKAGDRYYNKNFRDGDATFGLG